MEDARLNEEGNKCFIETHTEIWLKKVTFYHFCANVFGLFLFITNYRSSFYPGVHLLVCSSLSLILLSLSQSNLAKRSSLPLAGHEICVRYIKSFTVIEDDLSKRLTCPFSKTNARLTGQIQYMRDLQFVSLLLNVGGGILARN